jgi:hypothetical protein
LTPHLVTRRLEYQIDRSDDLENLGNERFRPDDNQPPAPADEIQGQLDEWPSPSAIKEVKIVQVDNAGHEVVELHDPGLEYGSRTEIEFTCEVQEVVGAVAANVDIQDGHIDARWTHGVLLSP